MGTSASTILCPVIYTLTNCTFCWHSISIREEGERVSAMGICRTFRCWSPVLTYSFSVGRVTIRIIVDCELSCGYVAMVRILFLGIQSLVWLFLSCFILFYKDFFLFWTNNFIVKVVLCMVCCLLLDVKLFESIVGISLSSKNILIALDLLMS